MKDYLDFEKEIVDLENKIEELRSIDAPEDEQLSLADEIESLQRRCQKRTQSVYESLTPWQVTQIARHPDRPHTLDYIEHLVTDFSELHGDRMFADDPAIVAGIGRFETNSIAIIGHQKGRDTKQKMHRNFGMAKPEGYRKAARIMELAQRFKLPLITLIDTPGAYPGIDAEERGQSEAIAHNLLLMSSLKTPIISIITGEGGSGGALAIGVCDRLMMLKYSTYSVISPEGCASILWKSADRAADAATAMGVTSKDLSRHHLVDQVIEEPIGGAHRDIETTVANLRQANSQQLKQLQSLTLEELLEQRQQKYLTIGRPGNRN